MVVYIGMQLNTTMFLSIHGYWACAVEWLLEKHKIWYSQLFPCIPVVRDSGLVWIMSWQIQATKPDCGSIEWIPIGSFDMVSPVEWPSNLQTSWLLLLLGNWMTSQFPFRLNIWGLLKRKSLKYVHNVKVAAASNQGVAALPAESIASTAWNSNNMRQLAWYKAHQSSERLFSEHVRTISCCFRML